MGGRLKLPLHIRRPLRAAMNQSRPKGFVALQAVGSWPSPRAARDGVTSSSGVTVFAMDSAKKTDVATLVKVEAAELAPNTLPPDAITNPLRRPGLHPSPAQVCEEGLDGAQGIQGPHQGQAREAYSYPPTAGMSPLYHQVQGPVKELTKSTPQPWGKACVAQQVGEPDFTHFYKTDARPRAQPTTGLTTTTPTGSTRTQKDNAPKPQERRHRRTPPTIRLGQKRNRRP